MSNGVDVNAQAAWLDKEKVKKQVKQINRTAKVSILAIGLTINFYTLTGEI
ncbi:hypothetical protein [Leptolyngbya sp. FACHB-671]|uniref:hypothetical protein n=1 Tax=Leptolyngbya sp. FACHB-671 TaxID=2692812 RepID=UPI001A7E710C|nr:hypothetical protein [Leptolyngbya sp. FACHB-671]